MTGGFAPADDLVAKALYELPVLVRACRLLEAAKSGAEEDVSRALAALRKATASISAAAGALELRLAGGPPPG